MPIPTDPRFSQQWYLHNSDPDQFDLNIVDVWDDYTGDGVRLTVFDSGFQVESGPEAAHADFVSNYRDDLDWDYFEEDGSPQHAPEPDGNPTHGTRVIGVIAAEAGNGIGGVGVSWDAEVVGYRRVRQDPENGFKEETYDDATLDAAGLGNGVGNISGWATDCTAS